MPCRELVLQRKAILSQKQDIYPVQSGLSKEDDSRLRRLNQYEPSTFESVSYTPIRGLVKEEYLVIIVG